MKCNTPQVYQQLENELLKKKTEAFDVAMACRRILGPEGEEQFQFWNGVSTGYHMALARVSDLAEQTCNGCDSEG